MMHLTFATRPSGLARWQTARVIQLLQAVHPGLTCTEIVIATGSDRALEEALLSGEVHAAVFSLDDLPIEITPGLIIAAIPERGSVHDVLVSPAGWTLSGLPADARIGTPGLRRVAQLLARRPDLTIWPISGNVETRFELVANGEFDAIVLAEATLIRLGLQAQTTEVFPLDVMLPAPGQAALAVQCRADDEETFPLLHAIHNPVIAAAVDAERALLSHLRADGSTPVAAYAENDAGTLILTGAVFSPDGKQSIRLSAVDTDPHRLAERLAGFVLERGAADLLRARV